MQPQSPCLIHFSGNTQTITLFRNPRRKSWLYGAEKADNLVKVKIKEHISFIAQALGKIE